jgi:hypothetical protein
MSFCPDGNIPDGVMGACDATVTAAATAHNTVAEPTTRETPPATRETASTTTAISTGRAHALQLPAAGIAAVVAGQLAVLV